MKSVGRKKGPKPLTKRLSSTIRSRTQKITGIGGVARIDVAYCCFTEQSESQKANLENEFLTENGRYSSESLKMWARPSGHGAHGGAFTGFAKNFISRLGSKGEGG